MGRYSVIEFSALWEYVANFCKKAGRTAARPVLLLYYVMMSPKTPVKDKWMVATAIAYVVLPIDLISAKKLPIIGWIDELVSLAAAYEKVSKYVTPEMERQADQLLDRWLPLYTPYVEVTES